MNVRKKPKLTAVEKNILVMADAICTRHAIPAAEKSFIKRAAQMARRLAAVFADQGFEADAKNWRRRGEEWYARL